MHLKCALVQGIRVLWHYLGIFCPLHPCFSVGLNHCCTLKGVWKEWDIPKNQLWVGILTSLLGEFNRKCG